MSPYHALHVRAVSSSDTVLLGHQILLRTVKPGCLPSEPLHASSAAALRTVGQEVTGEVLQDLLPSLAALKELACLPKFSS